MRSLFVIFSTFIFISANAQTGLGDADLNQILKEREKMFNSLMKGMFSDEPMDDSFFNGMNFFGESTSSSSIEIEWKNTKDGRRLEINPKNKKSPINIDINNDRISLSGKVVEEQTDEKGNIISKSSSSFSQSMSVPQELDSSSANIKQEGNKIVVDFTFKKDIKKLDKKTATKKKHNSILKPLEDIEVDAI